MSWSPQQQEEQQALIPLKAQPIKDNLGPGVLKQSLWDTARHIWGWLRGNTENDVCRMREGGVQLVEGKGRKAIAEAEVLVAEAANKHADATLKIAQAEALTIQANSESIKTKAEALKALAEAISIMRQNGGDVFFDADQLERFVFDNINTLPPKNTSVVVADIVPPPNIYGGAGFTPSGEGDHTA